MQTPARPIPPNPLTDTNGAPLRVHLTREPKNIADRTTTQALIEAYTDKDGFHCPKCGKVITNPDKAVEHLEGEINKTLDWLNKQTR